MNSFKLLQVPQTLHDISEEANHDTLMFLIMTLLPEPSSIVPFPSPLENGSGGCSQMWGISNFICATGETPVVHA